MVDAELPTTQNPLLYYQEGFRFLLNRRLIRKFVKKYPDVLINNQGRIVSLAISNGYDGALSSGYESKKILEKLFQEYKVVN